MQVDKIQDQQEQSVELSKQRPHNRPVFVLAALVGVFILVTVLVYRLPIPNCFTRAVVSVIPYPAATVNARWISMADYIDEYDAFLQYLKTTGAEKSPAMTEIKQTILDALVNKAAIREVAFRRGVKIDRARVDAFYQDVVLAEGSEEAFRQELKKTFDWTPEKFKERIIHSIVLAIQMNELILADEEIQAPVKQRLAQTDEKDLGFVQVEELPETWRVVADLPIGESTDILESDAAFAILRVEDRMETTEGTQVHLFGKDAQKKTLEVVVLEYLQDAKVRTFVR